MQARIHVLQTGGTLVSPAVPNRRSRRSPLVYTGLLQPRASRIEVPVKAFLVEVAGHRVLVDAGWSERCAHDPLGHLGFGLWFASEPVLRAGEGLAGQLDALGVRADGLDAVVMTHLDCDHASGLADIPRARRVLASAAEWRQAATRDVRYRPSFWRDAPCEDVPLSYDANAPFGLSCDLFGDGTVRIVFTPGHSAGSVCVVARNPETGRFSLVVGDTGYNRASWDDLLLPGPLHDAENMRRSLAWVRDMRALPNCAGTFAAHDPEVPAGTYSF